MLSITRAPIILAGHTIPYGQHARHASAHAGSRGIAPQYRSTIEASGRTTVATTARTHKLLNPGRYGRLNLVVATQPGHLPYRAHVSIHGQQVWKCLVEGYSSYSLDELRCWGRRMTSLQDKTSLRHSDCQGRQ